MKARMKKLMLISIPVVGLALLVVSGLALAAVHEWVCIEGQPAYVPGVGFKGPATLTIRGEKLEGTVLVTRVGDPQVERGPVIYVPDVQHYFDFGDGNTLTTVGDEIEVPKLEEPWVLMLNGYMKVTDGTGDFDGATGLLQVSGEIDTTPPPSATFYANGSISGYKD